ncbi:hypothetical protein ACSBL2_24980 [Pedobacter sp. AW31-3R]|uniref:hypothetical protein n=1 Tax=Pedobacter sp. AW31-3R TaxID=3445781 RepID=UPI003FA01F80
MQSRTIRSTNNSDYDRIFKENIDVMLPSIAGNMLNMDILKEEGLPTDIQHTKERKPDFLKRVWNREGKASILHIECQTRPDPKMRFRMAEYYIMLLRKYEIPVKQYVLFLGKQEHQMETDIKMGNFEFNYSIKSFIDIDYNYLLNNSSAESKVFSILCNFNGDSLDVVVGRIIQGLREVTTGITYNKYLNQLGILSQLRKNNNLFEIIMNYEPRFTKEYNPFYQGGKAEGLVEGRAEGLVEGRVEGLVEGRVEGLVEGRVEGMIKGAKETSRKIALRLKEAGIPFEQIAKATELSPSVIKRLKNTDQ